MADLRLQNEVRKLRRQALEIARSIVAEEHPEYDSIDLEKAACDLADAQMQQLREEKDQTNEHVGIL